MGRFVIVERYNLKGTKVRRSHDFINSIASGLCKKK